VLWWTWFDASSAAATELDRYYMLTVLDAIDACSDRSAAEPFREYWRAVIDLANIRLTLRRIADGTEEMELIGGGMLPTEKLQGIVDKSQLAEVLQGTPYGNVDVQDAGTRLERGFLAAIGSVGSRANAKHPLKSGPVVNFIIQKELEVRNLNIILKLKGEGFKAEEINDLLVVGA